MHHVRGMKTRVTIDCGNCEVTFYGANADAMAEQFQQRAEYLASGTTATVSSLLSAQHRVSVCDGDDECGDNVDVFAEAVSSVLGEAALSEAMNADEMVATLTIDV